MKIRVALVLAFLLLTAALHAEKISLIGATVINPADGRVLPNGAIRQPRTEHPGLHLCGSRRGRKAVNAVNPSA